MMKPPNDWQPHDVYKTRLYRSEESTKMPGKERKYRIGAWIALAIGIGLLCYGLYARSLEYKPTLTSQFGNVVGGATLAAVSLLILLNRWISRLKVKKVEKDMHEEDNP